MSPAFRPVFVGLAMTALATSGCVVDAGAIDGMRYVDRQEKRFTVQGRPELKVSTFDGSIEVRPWDQPDVMVVIERRASTREAAERIDVRIEQDGDRITVAVPRPERAFDWRGGRSARLIVSTPSAADLNARSGDGSVDVDGVKGRIEIFTGDGSIRGTRLSGELRLGTGDGSIRVAETTGTLTAQTGDGSVNVEGSLSGITVRTGDGTVTVAAAPGSAAIDDWTIATGDGSVILDLPDAFNADLDAHTGDGRINVENLKVSEVTGKMATNRLRGHLGTGGRLLRIRTGDGSITLRKTPGSLKAEKESQ